MTHAESPASPPHDAILVATDLDVVGGHAVEHGAALASALAIPLVVAHVVATRDAIAPLLPHTSAATPDLDLDARASVALRHHVRAHASATPGRQASPSNTAPLTTASYASSRTSRRDSSSSALAGRARSNVPSSEAQPSGFFATPRVRCSSCATGQGRVR